MIRRMSLVPALLDDRDVGRRVADHLVDRRRDHRSAVPAVRGLAAPAEDDQVGFLLGGGLDDPLGGVTADPHDRMDGGPVRREVEHALEEAPGVAGAGGAFAQRHSLRDLDDAQGRELAGARVEESGAQPDQLLGGGRVGDGNEDPGGQWPTTLRAHRFDLAAALAGGFGGVRPGGAEPLPAAVPAFLAAGGVVAAGAASRSAPAAASASFQRWTR